MARDDYNRWGTGGDQLAPLPSTTFAEALGRISRQWVPHDLPSAQDIVGKNEAPGPDGRGPQLGRASCGTQTVGDAGVAGLRLLGTTTRRGFQEGLPAWQEEDSPPSYAGWSPATERPIRDSLGRENERGESGGLSKEGSRRASLGEVAGEKGERQREWYQRMLLALKLKQAKRIEDMEARFEEELRRRTDMHETALQQMAAQAAVASSSAQACAAAQAAVRDLEGQLRDAQVVVTELQGRLAKQQEELELRREYDLYKQRSAHEKELAAVAEKQRAQLEQLQAEMRQAVAAREEAHEGQQALRLQHEAEMRHLQTEHAAQFASAHAQMLAAQQAVAARGEAEAAATALAVAQARSEYESKLAAALRSLQDSHAERCDLLEQHWQQASQRQSHEYELVINELRAALATCDPAGEPVPVLRTTGLREAPESPRRNVAPQPGPGTRLGPRRPGNAPSGERPGPLARTQSSPPRLPPPARVASRVVTPQPASEPRGRAKSPERGPGRAQQRTRPSPNMSPREGSSPAPMQQGRPSTPPERIPYQELMSSLHELDQRMARSPPRHRVGLDQEALGSGSGAQRGWQPPGYVSPPPARPLARSAAAKRAPARSYLDRLLRQLREEQTAAQRGGSHDQELLSSGTKSLPPEHWNRTKGGGIG
ncbi:hypothetical protein KFL_002830110 [Klebsormidium nitens]|uniref:Uncharacterized protein n=1 Tax=Klebsormidium nitens TaxID=105231 RepID=A0A1Y1I5U4_KLENI|nr:hypothetical protein KFL_002830110 [Klebsormidium nitens]|eukprot:GAQ86334.1 hypothetical protein KFL_002830110 [Klebsormidium nitens]